MENESAHHEPDDNPEERPLSNQERLEDQLNEVLEKTLEVHTHSVINTVASFALIVMFGLVSYKGCDDRKRIEKKLDNHIKSTTPHSAETKK